MLKEYLVEITKKTRHWIKAIDEYEASSIAEDIEDENNSEIEDIEIIDEREVEAEDAYLEYLDDEEEEDIEEEW